MVSFYVDFSIQKCYSFGMSFFPWIAAGAVTAIVELTNPIPQVGEANYNPEPSHHMRMTLDNDVFFGDDQDYTNGLRFDYTQRMDDGNYWGLSLTQNIYTPSTNGRGNIRDEHPYAGYLALGAAYITTGKNFGTSTELQLGTTGNPSLAEEAQDLIHNMGDMGTWHGWDEQISAEFTMQLTGRQDWNICCLDKSYASGWQQDALFFTQEELGTVSLAASAGVVYRYGKNLPARMRNMGNGATHFGVSSLTKEDYDISAPSYFVLAGTSLKYVARDLFIDGGVFHNFNQTCSRMPWVAEVQLGVGVVYEGIDYYMGAIYRTDSFRTQENNTLIGTISLGWNW